MLYQYHIPLSFYKYFLGCWISDAWLYNSKKNNNQDVVKQEILRNNLKQIRTRLGMNQKDLANLAGVTRQTISGVESAQYAPSTTISLRLAKALGLSDPHTQIQPLRLSNRRTTRNIINTSLRHSANRVQSHIP